MSKTGRLPHAERREQIARAALDILGAHGLAGLTTAALASAVGLTSGALFRHFASLEEILEATVERAAAQVDGTFPDPALPAGERLRALALERVRLISAEPGIAWLLRSSQAPRALPPTAAKRLRQLVRRSRTYVRRTLGDAIAAGAVRTDVEPDVLLLVYTATIHALIGGRSLAAGRVKRAQHHPSIDGLLALLAPPVGTANRS